jgi:translocator protein
MATSASRASTWTTPKQIGVAVLFVVVCLSIGWITGGATETDTAWFRGLEKPAFQPPDWIFGPVWTLLYIMMGVAAFLVFRRGLDAPGVKAALVAFVAQLALNAAWTPVFFAAQSLIGALVIIIALVVLLLVTVRLFFGVDRLAGWLLVPYLLWVSFATVLNATLFVMN